MIIREYLCHCYLYYGLDENVISDHEFDELCQRINTDWDIIDDPWMDFIKKHGEYKGGVKGLSLLPDQYPEPIRMRAKEMLMNHEDLQASLG